MEVNGPGISLFQENELSSFDNLERREEEEDALEEERKRELELKNELENAFDDVSFENDEESLCNGSENRSSSAHSAVPNNRHSEVDSTFFEGTAHNRCSNDKDSQSCRTDSCKTPFVHPVKNVRGKNSDLRNEYENFSDECRKKIQNGNLHDLLDQSGGGDQNIQTLLHYNHCFQRNSIGEAICNVGPNNNSSGNNSINSNNNNNNSNNNKNNNLLKTKYCEEAEDGNEHLKILYDVRVREVHKLTEFIDSMKNKHEIEVNDLKHQLALLLAEKERVTISHSQLQNLLIDCKQQVECLVNDVNTLEKVKKELESSKQELMNEVDNAKIIIDDLQRKLIILEKGTRNKIEVEQCELNLKAQLEKHNLELMNMKKELDNCMRNYEAVLKENEELKLKIINLGQINDENLAKKSEIISRLSQQIEETQMQFENLVKLSVNEGNFRLQAELKLLKEEKSQLALKIENLERDKCKQEEMMKQYESLSNLFFLNKDGSNNLQYREFEGSEISGKLGAELFRAINSQKAKRLEIKNLQTQLEEKNKQILLMEESEKSLTRELENLKEEIRKCLFDLVEKENLISQKTEENLKLQSQLQELQEKQKICQCEIHDKYVLLEEETKLLKSKISELEKEHAETMSTYGDEHMRFHNEGIEKVRNEMEKYFKLEILKKNLENETLKKEIDEIKNLYLEVYNAKGNSELDKERNSPGHGNMVDLEEVKRLQKELEKSRLRILELDETLKQQYEQEVEILNLDINQLKLQLEKLKKEKDREIAEKDKFSVENELLKTEIEQVTSEKNLLFLDYEKLLKEAKDIQQSEEKLRENSKLELKKLMEKHSFEMQNLSNKYEITIKKLKKEIELTVKKSVKSESKHTSPIRNDLWLKNLDTQECPFVSVDKSTSPISNHEIIIAPTSTDCRTRLLKDKSVLTDPEPVQISKREVMEMMEKLGAHHEEEMMSLEKKYCADLLKLEKKFHLEIDKAKEIIRRELEKEHCLELEQLHEKHRIEMINRIEQEKKEAVVDLITEWACEVQSLKVSYAESQAEMEKMKMKYKAAKSVALHYKTYFKKKAEHMKEEWKRVEEGYEKALKELEKNVHILVDVKEDEVKSKVESITKLYEEKISKMKKKLCKFEEKLKTEKESKSKIGEDAIQEEKTKLERLVVPDGNLCKNFYLLDKKELLTPKKRLEDCKGELKEPITFLKKKTEDELRSPENKCQQRLGIQKGREKTNS